MSKVLYISHYYSKKKIELLLIAHLIRFNVMKFCHYNVLKQINSFLTLSLMKRGVDKFTIFEIYFCFIH